jgi:hypothetical protein
VKCWNAGHIEVVCIEIEKKAIKKLNKELRIENGR